MNNRNAYKRDNDIQVTNFVIKNGKISILWTKYCYLFINFHRKRLLRAVEGICRSTNMAFVYITHHFQEELVPSISNALHLKDHRAVYNGSILDYCPEDYNDDNDHSHGN